MNSIEKLGLEKCKQIVDGAPKHAEYYSPLSYSNKYKKSVRDNTHEPDVENGYTKSYDFWDGRKWNGCACMLEHLDDLILISSIRTAIAEHNSKDGIKKNDFKIGDFIRYMGIDGNTPMFEVYEVVGFASTQVGGDGYQIKNKLGRIDFCYGDNYALVDCGITDDCTDIHNHVSPNTVVIER